MGGPSEGQRHLGQDLEGVWLHVAGERDDRDAQVPRLVERRGEGRVHLLMGTHLADAVGLRDEGDADIIALMTEDDRLVACGALAGHTVKQLAVAPDAEGQGAMAAVLSALISEAYARGVHRLFLCTKPENLRMFGSMGFHIVIETKDAVLLENRKGGLDSFLESIPKYDGVCGAVVCNCDPFTLGHRHLIEYAVSHCDDLYVFAVSEKGSMFSPQERLEMIRKGTEDIANCHVFESDLYLISRATFPAYFIRDESRADLRICEINGNQKCDADRRRTPSSKGYGQTDQPSDIGMRRPCRDRDKRSCGFAPLR